MICQTHLVAPVVQATLLQLVLELEMVEFDILTLVELNEIEGFERIFEKGRQSEAACNGT